MMEQPTELHIANNIEKLNIIAASNSHKAKHCNKELTLMKIAKTLYHKSQLDLYDEEMMYIMLFRFISVYSQLLIISNDSGFVASMLGTEARKAKAQFENLKNSLISRYTKTSIKSTSVESMPVLSSRVVERKAVFNNASFISCTQLADAWSTNVNLLVIDIRSKDDFAESHTIIQNCINIPESLIHSGLSAYRLGLSLPSSCKEQWDKRDSFDVIILMDWNTGKTNFAASKLDKLRTILVEWDIEKQHISKPAILNEGYLEWLEMYPMYCTNSDVKYSKANIDLDDILNMDAIDYPTNAKSKSHEVFEEKLAREDAIAEEEILSGDQLLDEEHVVIVQNKDIPPNLPRLEGAWRNIHERITHEYNISELKRLKEEEQNILDEISKLGVRGEPVRPLQDSSSAKLENIDKLLEHLDIDKEREELTRERQRLLDEARQAKKPGQIPEVKSSEKPAIDRATKPKEPSIISHTASQPGSIVYGLTGLTNIKNTCYMNTIIQCLRHLPQIREFYCNGDYIKHIHSLHPHISKEMGHLVRSLWSNSYCVIPPQKFYKKLTSLAPIYGEGHHEDCMEFFLQLYNFLNDDCTSDVVARSFWSETQMAWHKQHGGTKSFFINTFYHQIRRQYSCKICKTSNLKFDIENIFYLSIPNETFTLEDCMHAYLKSTEQIFCKDCKEPMKVDKQISFYPPVLVVVLKRHIQEFAELGVVDCRKNDNQCYFPTDNFQVQECFYKLHAVALHSGTIRSGHYTAACLSPNNNKWYLFDDENVREINVYESWVREKAYAFFYSLQKTV